MKKILKNTHFEFSIIRSTVLGCLLTIDTQHNYNHYSLFIYVQQYCACQFFISRTVCFTDIFWVMCHRYTLITHIHIPMTICKITKYCNNGNCGQIKININDTHLGTCDNVCLTTHAKGIHSNIDMRERIIYLIHNKCESL